MVSTVPRRSTTGRPSWMSLNVSSSLASPAPFQANVARSRTEDDLGAAGRLALALPDRRDVLERVRLDVDDDVAVGNVGGERPVALAADLDRRQVDPEAAHVERDRADAGRGERDLDPGELADLDVAGVVRGGAHGGERGLAPQR